ncbi:MAG: polysulfide reductase NrfD [Peptococcaceae bacterium]|nr:polysulfide reductase NrfD [Peptococcaceae bacterium]
MKKNNSLLWIAMICGIIGFVTWVYQSVAGLAGTGMRNSFPWGLYVACFEFYVGAAAGSMLVCALAHISGKRIYRPVARVAAFVSLACTVAAGMSIVFDLGSAHTMGQLLLSPNLASPLLWDIVVMSAFLALAVIMVLPQIRPQIKLQPLLVLIALGMSAVLGLVTALLFATQKAQPMWNTLLFPLDALLVGYALGAALVILFAIGLTKKDKLAERLTSFGFLAKIVAFCLIGHLGLTAIDTLPILVGSSIDNQLQNQVLFGQYGGLFVLEILLLAGATVMFLSKKFTGHYKPLLLAGVFVAIGAFVNKMLLLASFNVISLSLEVDGAGLWSMPVSVGTFAPGTDSFVTFWNYTPTLTEIGVSLLPLAVALVIIAGLNNYALKQGSEEPPDSDDGSGIEDDAAAKVVYRIPLLKRIPPPRQNQ